MILSIPLLTTQEADNPTDHLKPEKVQPHIVVQGPERGINPLKSSLSFPVPFYWPVFD